MEEVPLVTTKCNKLWKNFNYVGNAYTGINVNGQGSGYRSICVQAFGYI